MADLSLTIAPKSDQLNSDDLIPGPLTVHITKVSANPDSAEQPISIYFEGDNNKPYKPCKSMRRVLVQVWGKDGSTYPGRSMTLYRDPQVQFGGLAVGGIRISSMSHIDKSMTMALTATRANRKPFTVKPLVVEKAPTAGKSNRQYLEEWEAAVSDALLGDNAQAIVDAIFASPEFKSAEDTFVGRAKEWLDRIKGIAAAQLAEVRDPEVE